MLTEVVDTPDAIFALCICAFVLTALGLSIWLWRKQRQANAIGKVPPGESSIFNLYAIVATLNKQLLQGAAGAGEATEVEHNRLAGIFKRKKDRPSPLPLSSIRNPNDPTLPPYSPFAAGPGQSPWTSNNFTFQTAQGAQTGLQNEHEDTNADARSVKSMANLSRAQREAAERAGNPFSPFVPFSPVTTTAPVATQTSAREQLNDADDEDKQAVRSFSRRNDPTFNASSSLHHSVTMPTPAPVRYMDPEVAQAMGIHPEVIKTAEPGVSEEEIERRRVRAQRRLEERQRADEGSIVEDTLEASHFSQIASNRRA